MAAHAPLRDRLPERQALDGLLEAVRGGESRALVVHGEPGIGKTALLQYGIESASDVRVARAVGVESEMELPFAGLHQLCAPMLDRLDRLADPQHDALCVAFGLSAGGAPDRFLVGLATLTLLAEVADEKPLLCVVDDAHWLDRASAQVLAFVARRLVAESVGLVFGTRELSEDFSGLPELHVEGLRNTDARALLASAIRGPIDERVRERFLAETHGNPLALLEVPRALAPGEVASGFGLPDALALPARIEDSFRRRLEPLPAGTRRLLLIAAAEPLGEPVLVWRSAERLGIGAEAAAPAVADGLVEFGARVRFRHPLVRSVVYRLASPEERQSAHRALADVTDPDVDPDRRAWHRARAAPEPDEDVAAELERSAGRARARGGLAAAAAFLERATELTPDPVRRAERALAAAQTRHQAGAADAALALLATAEAGPLDELQRARVDLLRAQIAFAIRRGSDAPALLLKAARQLQPLDEQLARETYLDAFVSALSAQRLTSDVDVREVAEAARATLRSSDPPRAPDLLLEGWILMITEGFQAGAPVLKRALRAFRRGSVSREEALRWLWFACHTAYELWDDDNWYVLSTRQVQLARDAGALSELPIALNSLAGAQLFEGDSATAAALVEESEAVTDATGGQLAPYAAALLAAARGREAEASELIEASMVEVSRRGEGLGLIAIAWASAILYNGLGRYVEALNAARKASDDPYGFTRALPELIEAATRSGMLDGAADALKRLSEITRAGGNDWGLGIEARSRALLSDDQEAERLYREAIERLGRTRVRVELARAHLLYGEWLRREGRRLDAREQLRSAHEMLSSMGFHAFAERAERELLATGETARARTTEARDELTPQEAHIAQMARDGASNQEIATELFITRKTVEYHLHKVFIKLGISSRNQLGRALSVE